MALQPAGPEKDPMKKTDIPVTSAVRFLRANDIKFEPYYYTYEEHGGTKVASAALGIDEHCTVKTIIMETDERKQLIVLMHGDREVSTKNLARTIGVKSVQPCDDRTAERATGYVFGGMSPFGTRNRLPVYIEKSIMSLEQIFINGGKRGFLVKLDPSDLNVLSPILVETAIIPA
jgi:Cys-tRNA(Pro) deacylase